MTLLADTAAVSRRVSETSSRLEKIRELAEHLRRLAPDEIPITIAFLSGETRQGKLGVAYAALRSAEGSPAAPQPALTLQDVDAALAAPWAPLVHPSSVDPRPPICHSQYRIEFAPTGHPDRSCESKHSALPVHQPPRTAPHALQPILSTMLSHDG